ncbi:hypothetical protein [Endozoicomonas arenosclerae]|uniref:hypothetical protein n=1 Tax=Endozoicomonas arenosclerae TaxID=1633495 RepID=UPI000AEB8657|nr:hypothetical protein [Endozoicomonas arenosclerae]
MLKRLLATRKHPWIPGCDEREAYEIDFSGSLLKVELPPHHDYEGFPAEPVKTKINLYDDRSFTSIEQLGDIQYKELYEQEGLETQGVTKRSWELYGPVWREQPVGTVDFSMVVCRSDALPESMSCFNPNHFEQLLIRDLYFDYPMRPTKGYFSAPVNWRVKEVNGSTWVYQEVHMDFSQYKKKSIELLDSQPASFDSHLFIPLDQRYFLRVNFWYLGYAPVASSLQHMNELRDSVINSIQLSLSPSAQAALNDAKKRWPDASASQSRSPELWVYPQWRQGEYEVEPDTVITRPGDQPPELIP